MNLLTFRKTFMQPDVAREDGGGGVSSFPWERRGGGATNGLSAAFPKMTF